MSLLHGFTSYLRSVVYSDTTGSALSLHSGHDRIKGKKKRKKEEAETRGCVVGVSYITTTAALVKTITVALVTTMFLSIQRRLESLFFLGLGLGFFKIWFSLNLEVV
ncbi:hypothetical protein F2Q69_00034997 [Brassica cretica]|uniref:Uncharacterized protein n=1 Tax=Brassica cretica TaxID=69181 RepID=A0A8S9SR09_BRACR|nr:hypothetical protein F2Q69_00034997 [Brassica cretica]